MDGVVLWGLLVLVAVAKGVSSSVDRHYYEDIGCVPQHTDQDGSVTSYDCSSLAGRRADRCYYKGQDYPEDAELPTTPDTACLAHCRCVNSTDHSRLLFDCVSVECPEDLGVRPGPHCHYVYDHDHCCGVQRVCVPLDKPQEGCLVDHKMYNYGEKIYSDSAKCLTCICKQGFAGQFVEPFCRKISCNLDLVASERLAEGCVPVYFKEDGCCPFDWRCPNSTDTVVPSTSSDRSSSTGTCRFGSLTMQVGDSLNPFAHQPRAHCSCRVPPHPVCVQQ